MSTSPSGTLGPGTEFGRYTIVKQVGRGAFGVVYEARRNPLKKRVALKILHEHVLSTPDAVTRFQREIMSAAQVEHPHVIQVFDGGVRDERGFLAMEFLEGETLGERLKREKTLSVEDIVDVMVPIASALDAVHNAGVVHRDIKPGNIFLVRHLTGVAYPKLVDFGIAKLVSDDLDLTQTHSWLGTPFYMSPEQVRQSKSVDARSDQWSLAVVLYEALTGEKPFRNEVLLDLLEAITTRSPAVPSSMRATVPKGLDTVIVRMMERDPVKRFPSMRAAGTALWPFASPRVRALWARHFDREGDPASRVEDVIELRESGLTSALRPRDSLDPPTLHLKVAAGAPDAREGDAPYVAPRPGWMLVGAGAALGVAGLLAGQHFMGGGQAPTSSTEARPDVVADTRTAPHVEVPPIAPLAASEDVARPAASQDASLARAEAGVIDAGAPHTAGSQEAPRGGGGGGGGGSVHGAPYCDDDPAYQAACAALQSGNRSAAATLFQTIRGPRSLVAQAHLLRHAGRLVDAEEKLEQAMSNGGDPWMIENTSFTNGLLNEVQGRLGYIEVSCPSGEVGIGAAGVARRYTLPRAQPLRAPTGRVQVVISVNGSSFVQAVDVRAGDTAHVTSCTPPAPAQDR